MKSRFTVGNLDPRDHKAPLLLASTCFTCAEQAAVPYCATMTRELRPRRSRPSYAAMFQAEDDQESTPKMIVDDEVDSGSDFALEDGTAKAGEVEAESDDDDDDEGSLSGSDASPDVDDDAAAEIIFSPKKSKLAKSISNSGPFILRDRSQSKLVPGLSRPSISRHVYALPTPSAHQRHRASALYHRTSPVERLSRRPSPFTAPFTVTTNSGTTTGTDVSVRVAKSWGYNIGTGPLWELMEDRAWFKEASEESINDGERRPRTHVELKVREGLQVLDLECVHIIMIMLLDCPHSDLKPGQRKSMCLITQRIRYERPPRSVAHLGHSISKSELR
jgi:transcription factor C subunit 6